MPTITTSNRTASSVTVNGSGFTTGLAISSDISLNSVEVPGTNNLITASWSITISTTSSANTYTFKRYGEDLDGNIYLLDQMTFLVPLFDEPFAGTLPRVTIFSFSKGLSTLKHGSTTRKRFPTI